MKRTPSPGKQPEFKKHAFECRDSARQKYCKADRLLLQAKELVKERREMFAQLHKINNQIIANEKKCLALEIEAAELKKAGDLEKLQFSETRMGKLSKLFNNKRILYLKF